MSDKELEKRTEDWRRFYGIDAPNSAQAMGDLVDNLHAGMKIKYCHPNNGYPEDQRVAQQNLLYNAVYTVKSWHIGSWTSTVELKGVPGHYNTVLFEEYK
jgi:hypothetical protein